MEGLRLVEVVPEPVVQTIHVFYLILLLQLLIGNSTKDSQSGYKGNVMIILGQSPRVNFSGYRTRNVRIQKIYTHLVKDFQQLHFFAGSQFLLAVESTAFSQ